METFYHVGDSVGIRHYNDLLLGVVIIYPRNGVLIHDDITLTTEPNVFHFDYLYENEQYRDRIATTSDGEIYAFNIHENDADPLYMYLIKLDTGETVFGFEQYLIPYQKELLTRTLKNFRRKRRDDTVAAIALGAEMPLDISRRIASLTLHPLSRNVGGRKKKRKTMKTRKTRKMRKTRKTRK